MQEFEEEMVAAFGTKAMASRNGQSTDEIWREMFERCGAEEAVWTKTVLLPELGRLRSELSAFTTSRRGILPKPSMADDELATAREELERHLQASQTIHEPEGHDRWEDEDERMAHQLSAEIDMEDQLRLADQLLRAHEVVVVQARAAENYLGHLVGDIIRGEKSSPSRPVTGKKTEGRLAALMYYCMMEIGFREVNVDGKVEVHFDAEINRREDLVKEIESHLPPPGAVVDPFKFRIGDRFLELKSVPSAEEVVRRAQEHVQAKKPHRQLRDRTRYPMKGKSGTKSFFAQLKRVYEDDAPFFDEEFCKKGF